MATRRGLKTRLQSHIRWASRIPSAVRIWFAIVSHFLQEVGNLMKQGSLKAGDVLQIFLPAQASSLWLNQEVVLIDRYGVYFS